MRLHSPTGWAACLASLVFAPPGAAGGQQGQIVANRVEVSSRAASLHLELSSGDRLEIEFSDGVATANGALLGRYELEGAADRAWRELLEAAMPLGPEPMARALARWRPGDGLPDADREILGDVDRLLEETFAEAARHGVRSPNPTPGGDRFQDRDEDRARALLRFMLRHGHVSGLGPEDLDVESLQFALGEDWLVPPGTSVDGSILVAAGDLSVGGRIRGHAIVVDGTVLLEEGGRVDGDIRLVDAELEHRGGSLLGQVVHVLRETDDHEVEDARSRHQREAWTNDRHQGRGWGVASRVGRATKGVFEAALSFLVLACLALLSTRLAGDRVDVVAQAVGDNPARSAVVGFAGSFLVLPIYVLGMVVLAITIVGIPVLLAWLPLFPVVVAAAGAVGYVAASGHVGRWVLGQEISKLERVDRHNPTHVKLVGIAALTAPFAVGAVVRAVPWVGWLGSLLQALGTLGCMAAVVVGLGAVIITRGGRRSAGEYAFADTLDADHWSSEIDDADLDDDSSRGSGS